MSYIVHVFKRTNCRPICSYILGLQSWVSHVTGGTKDERLDVVALQSARKFEFGRPPANTNIGVLCDAHTTRKTRSIDTVYNSSNNELHGENKTLVKNAIVSIDSTPFLCI